MPAPCVDDWNTTPPADPSTIRALKLELLNPLEPTDSFVYAVTMRAPLTGAPAGSVAWNSSARDAFEFPAQEPNKVGVRLDYFDLALRKTLASGQTQIVESGDTIDYTIKVINQGSIRVDSMLLYDYNESLLNLADANWTLGLAQGAFETAFRTLRAGTELPVGGLLGGDSVSVTIRMVLDGAAIAGNVNNYAEIAGAWRNRNPQSDFDGVFDNIAGNDTGGRPNVPGEDDEVNDDGTVDEDNHDVAFITIASLDLALAKKLAAGQSSIVSPGDTVAYAITVINQGFRGVGDIEVTDYIPNDMAFVDVTTGNVVTENGNAANIVNNGAGVVTIDTLRVGDTVNFTIRLKVNFGFAGSLLTNIA